MRNPIENISFLQKQLNNLQLENQLLKNILDGAGISYYEKIKALNGGETTSEYDSDQGARIKHPTEITEKMANLFYERFWGRQDIYALRYENKKTGRVGYYKQCHNRWKSVCPKNNNVRVDCKDCQNQAYKKLEKKDIIAHLKGISYNASDVVGVYPLLPNGTSRFLVYDFDNHEKGAENTDFANIDDSWIEEVESMRTICEINGIKPLVERSRSGRGAHVWILFDKPIDASLVRKFGFALLEKGAEQVNMKSFKYYDRMLPAQDELSDGGVGNLIALPLQGKALISGNSAFVDRNWNAYPNQWEVLFNTTRLSKEFLDTKLVEWTFQTGADFEDDENREKPWEKKKGFVASDVDGIVEITLSDGIYIDTINLKPGIQNKIRRLAVVSNPEFYKNKALGKSNYDTVPRIYMGKDHLSGYIQIPRGLYGELTGKLNDARIKYNVLDERAPGRKIDVTFSGELREEQEKALKETIKYDNGILSAATAFGKTVVCSAIIAEKKVNTLILLQSSALFEQWKAAFQKFLKINEELPTYKTKTGRERIRKSLIGELQGARDTMTGIVDIAMVGSICKKGVFHELLNQYGLIIVDESHHVAADTFTKVLQEVKAKYVYGVTATPKRGDGLEKINEWLLGPIRFTYTSKERAKAQGISHFVYPRFTRVVSPRGIITEKMHPNEAYEIIRNNELRDEQIIGDVKSCITAGRTPVVLSKYKDHSERLYEKLKEYADKVFLMTGNNSKKEHREILSRLNSVEKSESLILVATGKLIGEGFDFPRLDTLIMSTPVSFRGIVEQYAGRLNRDYEGKESVIVYDYVDSHIPMFDKMYANRLKAYKQIGYDIYAGNSTEKQKTNAIFDRETFEESYKKDLLESNKTIIISSPAISGAKVDSLINNLKERMGRGVSVTVVTWDPDSYGFGDASYWMQLHEKMRQNGIYLKTVEDFCERFAIIDSEIVWYGSTNLLAKVSVEDSMMRVESEEIAAELMELTFGSK